MTFLGAYTFKPTGMTGICFTTLERGTERTYPVNYEAKLKEA